jgi:diguanylate cyclase (GGDEF)-like protein
MMSLNKFNSGLNVDFSEDLKSITKKFYGNFGFREIEERFRGKSPFETSLIYNSISDAIVKGDIIIKSKYTAELLKKIGDNATIAMNELSLRDDLTGLYNRRHFDYSINREIGFINREGRSSLIMFDIDHFKLFNDKRGHLAGDYVLKEIAKITIENMRTGDICCRYGGEEFGLILPNASGNGAFDAASKLGNTVYNNNFVYDGENLGKVSISLGVSEFRKEDSLSDIVGRSDHALYEAKSSGRNKTVLYKD